MTNLQAVSVNPTLYEQDFNLWVQSTVKQIKLEKFADVDWENVLEELEGLTRSDKRELRNRLTVLLEHLLKLTYWESERDNNTRGWKGTIVEQRQQINLLLVDSPSLKPFIREIFDECYSNAREITISKTGLSSDIIPIESPFNIEQSLHREYLS